MRIPIDIQYPNRAHGQSLNRRALLKTSANGFGWLAASALMSDPAYGAHLIGRHFPARAKNVIFCFLDGGVSHVDSFDPKPKLEEVDGQPAGEIANPTANRGRKWLKSP